MKKDEEPPLRPECAQCSKPATHQIELTVRALELERDAGAHTAPYWSASYKRVRSQLTALLCTECVKGSVAVEIRVSATVAAATPK